MRNALHINTNKIWRGGEQQIQYLLDHPSPLNHYLFCVEQSELEKKNQDKAGYVFTFVKKSGFNVSAAFLLKKICKNYKIDILHIHDNHALNIYFIAYLSGLRVPAILYRRVDFATAQNMFSAWKYKVKGIKKIVCVSERVKNIFSVNKELYDKCEVVYDCIKTEKFQKINGRKILERDFPQLKDRFIVANIAALVDHKDYPTFIKAAYHLVKVLQIKDLHFLIVGQGEKEAEIRKMVDEYQLQSFITFTGHRKDIPQILNGIDVYTFTSKMEGFGSTILEVMASKVPIVATNTGGPAEILTHRNDALLSNPGDYISIAQNIEELKNNPDLKTSLINQAFQTVQNFSIEKYVEQIESIYEKILYSKMIE